VAKRKKATTAGTDRPLPDDLAAEVKDCLPEAERILGVDRDSLPAEEVHRRIFDWMHARWQSAEPLDDDEFDGLVVPLACLWGEMICEQLGWEWVWAEVKENYGPAIVSPDRSRLVYPTCYFRDKLTDRTSVPTTLLLYRMFRDGLGPPPEPGAFAVWG
jgi:hypothetical protein